MRMRDRTLVRVENLLWRSSCPCSPWGWTSCTGMAIDTRLFRQDSTTADDRFSFLRGNRFDMLQEVAGRET